MADHLSELRQPIQAVIVTARIVVKRHRYAHPRSICAPQRLLQGGVTQLTNRGNFSSVNMALYATMSVPRMKSMILWFALSTLAAISQTGEVHRDLGSEKIVL